MVKQLKCNVKIYKLQLIILGLVGIGFKRFKIYIKQYVKYDNKIYKSKITVLSENKISFKKCIRT